jgi:2'-5' RNA ligase superfamily
VTDPAARGGAPGHRWPGHSVLVVPVPALEPLIRERTRHYDEAYLSTDPTFAHAHVTVLGPFVDAGAVTREVHDVMRRVLRRHPRFVAWFEEVGQFPDGMIHLLPNDEGPFRRLTADLAAAFPAHQPYGGRYAAVRPHVTLDRAGPDVDIGTVRGWLTGLLPVRAEVDEVRLSWYEPDTCRTLATWPLC